MPVVIFLAFLIFAVRRLLTFLHIFQQEEYDGPRFLRWLWQRRAFDRRASAALIVAAMATLVPGVIVPAYVAPALAALALIGVSIIEPNPLKSGKKRLVLTARARRILAAAFVLLAATSALLLFLDAPLILWVLPVQAVPLALLAGNELLSPYESAVQRRFWNEAHAKLNRLQPTVIGITGSFGKTSIKHIVGHILSTHSPTLATPGSVNTPMGIARVVREHLTPEHRFFLCEMGAYGPGSIARLCRLAPPKIGVVSAIGHAHFERFRSLDTVARTKLELAEAVFACGGRMVIADQVLEVPYARDFLTRHRAMVTLVGTRPEADIRVAAIRQSLSGVEVDLSWKGGNLTLNAPLFGEHQGMNLALAFAVAEACGVPATDIVLSLRSTPQIAHRLEVKRQADGSILIDDAYNSNPIGFTNGLALLSLFGSKGGNRILVTPGMAELGSAHSEAHERVGVVAGRHADILLPVVPERIETLVTAFKATNPAGVVVPINTFSEAQVWMQENVKRDDVVLIENDLPDLYEARLSI